MNSFLKKIVIQSVLRSKSGKQGTKNRYSDFELAKGLRDLKTMIYRLIRDLVLITMGIFSASLVLKVFCSRTILSMAVQPVFRC